MQGPNRYLTALWNSLNLEEKSDALRVAFEEGAKAAEVYILTTSEPEKVGGSSVALEEYTKRCADYVVKLADDLGLKRK